MFTTRAVKRCIEVGQSYLIKALLQDIVSVRTLLGFGSSESGKYIPNIKAV